MGVPPAMVTHTVRLESAGGRWSARFSYEEACDMLDKGFRFAVFRPQEGLYQLSIPHQVAEVREHGTITFMQGEG